MQVNTFMCIDAHTCGNPVRVVVGGAPMLRGSTMAEKRAEFLAHHDWVRQSLMFEPRGHDAMSGTILYPAEREDCDIGWLFIEVSGCLPMCGHGTIGTVTVAIEQGLVVPRTPGKLAIEVPAGRVEVEYSFDGRFVDSVRLHNVASFLYVRDVEIVVPDLGTLKIDIAYGGNFYAIVEPQPGWRGLDDMTIADIQKLSPIVRSAAQSKVAPRHPRSPEIAGVSHVMWTDGPRHEDAHGRNVVFYGDKGIDRSPCGTGTSARMAQLAAHGKLGPGDEFIHESVIGTLFRGRVEARTMEAGYDAILPSVSGWARITGFNTLVVDRRDPLWQGFLLG